MAHSTMKPIEKATDAELIEFAEVYLGIETNGAKNRADIIGLIQQTWRGDQIPVEAALVGDDDQDEETKAVARQDIPILNKYPDPRWLIIIHSTHLPGGSEPVPLTCNGDVVVVNRDEEVPIPHRFMDSLRHAVRITLNQDPKTQAISETKFTAYPFEVLVRPSKSEIEKFRKISSQWTLGGDNSELMVDAEKVAA